MSRLPVRTTLLLCAWILTGGAMALRPVVGTVFHRRWFLSPALGHWAAGYYRRRPCVEEHKFEAVRRG